MSHGYLDKTNVILSLSARSFPALTFVSEISRINRKDLAPQDRKTNRRKKEKMLSRKSATVTAPHTTFFTIERTKSATMQYSHLEDHSEGSEHFSSVNMDDTVSQRSRASSFRRNSSANPELKEPLRGNGSGNNEDDPFYVFREDLYRKLDLVDDGLTEYLRIVHQTVGSLSPHQFYRFAPPYFRSHLVVSHRRPQDTSVNTHALKDAKKQLKRHIRNAELTLKDVNTTVQLVENQREKFSNISSSDLYERRALVTTSQDRITCAKADMNSEDVKAKLLADERAKAIRRAANEDDDVDVENAAFMADSQAHTSLLMQQQDETLDELGEAVVRVGQMADNIHEEIGLQNRMLSEMEDDLADAEEKLGLVMGKLAKFLKTKDKWQLGTILMLILVAMVLFFLVLTT
jgi:hypothetical protein